MQSHAKHARNHSQRITLNEFVYKSKNWLQKIIFNIKLILLLYLLNYFKHLGLQYQECMFLQIHLFYKKYSYHESD